MTEHPMTEATPLASEQITKADIDLGREIVRDLLGNKCAALMANVIPTAEKIAALRRSLSASPAPSGQGVSGEGGKWMPSEPTDAMLHYLACSADPRMTYAALLSTAPAPSCAPGEVERLRAALSAAASDCQLAHDALGNSPPAFDSVRRGFGIIRERILAALSPQGLDAKEGGVLDNTWTPYGKRSLKNLTDLLDIAGQKPTVVSVINRAYDEIVFLRALATPSQRLDAATVERAVEALSPAWFASDYNHRQAVAALRRALATDPHQHGGKGA